MKHILLPLIITLAIVSCKKEDSKVESEKPNIEIAEQAPIVHDTLGEVVIINEVSPDQLSLDMKNKANDTLYVTNFFATWCGPCMIEIPHFKDKMEELKDQPVKFTFVSLDNKTDWETAVSDFADEYDLRKNIVLLDGNLLDEKFFTNNFNTWRGDAIPFTLMKRGSAVDEFMGSMTKEEIHQKLTTMLANKTVKGQ